MQARVKGLTQLIVATGLVPCLVLYGCTGADGKDGANGTNGTSCTVAANTDGTKTITCDDGTTATVADGVSCSVADDGAGNKTITCDDGTTATVTDGNSCTVSTDNDGNKVITCDDGTTATVADGTSCTVANDGSGTTTITCDDGTTSTVTDGQDVDPTTVTDIQDQLAELAKVGPESCVVCHADAGTEHQAVYDSYSDASTLLLTIVDVVSVPNATDATKWDATMTFTVTKDGMPFASADNLPALAQKRFYTVRWDGSMFVDSQSFSNIKATATVGTFTATATKMAYQAEATNAVAYGYVGAGLLDTEGAAMYADVSNAGKVFGTVGYTSAATVSGCEKCHGAPYMKHGYRAAAVTGLPDFVACKACHFDNKTGGHEDWQILLDNPLRYAEIHNGSAKTAEEKAKYAYTANVMNDTHMSHAMEFPYPQSMANCATCHEGKLNLILTDANFNITTCKSCHVLDGSEDYETAGRALSTLWADAPIEHNEAMTCNSCHKAVGGSAPVFSAIHSGYDKKIYADAVGTKYASLFTTAITEATLTDAMLTVKFTVTEAAASTVAANPADVVPTLMVGLYGWDTKDYLVAPHDRDSSNNRLLEFKVDGTTVNPRFETVAAANGAWEIKVDLSMWQDLLDDGSVRRAEIAVMPALTIDGTIVALNAPSRTFDLVAKSFDDAYFADIVDVTGGCNDCHDALATTFHSADRGGSIRVCRLCHVTKSGGSHLEMQSRSIDSYVHAIHSFQAFDPGDIDFTDPVEKTRYELHVEHTYPNFTIKNCKSCHKAGAFEVPDQTKSLPGKLSKSDTLNVDRNIGSVPAYVTGPASRACGGCHRAHLINEDKASALAAFNQHTKMNGYLVVDGTDVLDIVFETIMGMFE